MGHYRAEMIDDLDGDDPGVISIRNLPNAHYTQKVAWTNTGWKPSLVTAGRYLHSTYNWQELIGDKCPGKRIKVTKVRRMAHGNVRITAVCSISAVRSLVDLWGGVGSDMKNDLRRRWPNVMKFVLNGQPVTTQSYKCALKPCRPYKPRVSAKVNDDGEMCLNPCSSCQIDEAEFKNPWDAGGLRGTTELCPDCALPAYEEHIDELENDLSIFTGMLSTVKKARARLALEKIKATKKSPRRKRSK